MRPGLACLPVVIAGIAHGAPPQLLATLSDDVDGDGTPDAIELSGDGVVHIAAKPRGEVKLAQAIARGRLAVAHYRGQHYVVAQVTPVSSAPDAGAGAEPPPGTEAVILRADGGVWHEVLRFPIGGVGLDHDYGIDVDATSDGIYRYQTRGDLRRCDGKPAYLFPEKFDGTRFRRSSALPSQVPDAAPVLAAALDAGPAAPPLLYQAHTASHQIGAGDAGGLMIPRELDDGRLDTLWREELLASSGEGQFFTFEPRAADVKAAQLRIVPGNPASSTTIKSFNRPRKIAVVTAQDAWRIELPDAANEAANLPLGAAFVVDLPRPTAGCVTVVLETTYGSSQGTTAIAELEVFAEGERSASGEALLAHVVALGANGATTAAAALGKRGASGAAAINGELATTTDPAVRRRLITALAQIPDPTAAPALAHAATAGWVRDQDLLDVIGALGALGQLQVLHDLAANAAVAVAARAAAVAQLPAAEAGLTLLVDLDAALVAARDGAGATRELRRAVIERLSRAPVAALIAAAAQGPAAVTGDLWRAMTRGVRAAPGGRAAVLAVLLAALPTATDYERQYRLIDGIAALGDAAALDTLAAWFRALPTAVAARAARAALRQVALRAIAATPRPEAARFVLDSAGDRDPGVRLAALAALAGEPDASDAWRGAGTDTIDRVIGDAIAHDRWPEVRRRAATALAARCQRPGPAQALGDAVDRDPDLAVRGDALSALVQCRAPGIAALLARIWDDARAPLELRSRAVLEAAALGDPQLAAALVGRFSRWRGEAISSAAALTLAQSAATSIGRLAPPGAARALADALDDTAFPEVAIAAALALGALGPACPPATKARLVALSREVDPVAGAAKRAAAQCGRARE